MKLSLRTVVKGALEGKSIGRILFNEQLRVVLPMLTGDVLDLAGGESPRYHKYLAPTVRFVRTNRVTKGDVVALDMNAPLPFANDSFDAVLFFNALYIAEDPITLVKEIRRILRPGGTLLLSSPLTANEMPEPHDYLRFTHEGLEKLFRMAGFSHISIERIGERGSAAMTLLMPFARFNVLRAILYPVALGIDACVPKRIRREHPTPLFYIATVKK